MATAAERMRAYRLRKAEAKAAAGVPHNPEGARKRKPASGKKGSRRKADVEIQTKRQQEAMRSVVVESRMRHQDITKRAAESNLAGSVLGILRLKKHITEGQYEAGVRYSEDMARYYSLTGIGHPSTKAQDLSRVKGIGGDPSTEAVKRAANKMMALEGALGVADKPGRPVRTLTNRICIMDSEDGIWEPHMMGHIKRGLDVLANFYQTTNMDDAKPIHPFG